VAYAAEIRARTESDLGFRVGGKLVERSVDLGQAVKPGQVLARLDAQDLQLGQASAQAAEAAARTNLDLASANLQRFQSLYAQGFIGAAELERYQTAEKSARAQWDQARAQNQVQRHQADYAVLRADAAGVITAVSAEPGRWWQPARRCCGWRRRGRAMRSSPCPKPRSMRRGRCSGVRAR
jgi:RND family efflux transporter MFP subunit